uniref:Integrase catalytic domain-containing protein n=1 Tax=Trichuris muris TaxID=70415 RepID=A0A5S6QHX4_TRIMR
MGRARLKPSGASEVVVDVLVCDQRPLGFDLILGMQGIRLLGGLLLDPDGRVRFNPPATEICAAMETGLHVEEKDFIVSYDSTTRSWTTAWKWASGDAPEVLHNRIAEYPPAASVRASYDEELETWIRNGWLVPYDEQELGPARGLIPLMAVVQRSKKKVRPVLDFRELNTYIDTYTARSDVCAEKLREWRQRGANIAILDLKKAYLQVRVEKSLWPYQTVMLRGRRYCLTRLGFGLNVAPTIMKAVVDRVLSLVPNISKGTSAYLDDILVDETVVSAHAVKRHLAQYGLECKSPEKVSNGARVLGLAVWGERNTLQWARSTEVGDPPRRLTKRSVFSYCGELIGHYPVGNWLRVATAFVKRESNRAVSRWDEPVDDIRIRNHLADIVSKLKKSDPVHGRWDVSSKRAKIWVDASMLALGVALEVDGSVIEDGAWLRPEEARHINMAELDAVIKGLNLAIAWRMKQIELMTDSATVHRWIEDALSGRARLRTKATNEMLIRRRLETVLALVKEYDLAVTITLVRSSENKADCLTRVPSRWLSSVEPIKEEVCATAGDPPIDQLITEVHHASGHPGVRRTLYFCRRRDPRISKREVSRVVGTCDVCRSIDPAPVKWRHGVLEVPSIWQRVGIDVVHCGSELYLSLTDCGPSRFSIWRRLDHRSCAEIALHLESIFLERGAPDELLADNDTAFRSREVARLAEKWGTRIRFRCAYVPSGNGIAERCHRTVKVIAARTGCSIREAVYRYNLMPRDDHTSATAPANVIYRYTVRDKNEAVTSSSEQSTNGPYVVGEPVWVKSRGGRCDDRYERGMVTGLLSDQAVRVNGVPRHVRDIRRRGSETNSPANLSSDSHSSSVPSAHVTEPGKRAEMIILGNAAQPQPSESLDAEQSLEQGQVATRRSTRRGQRRMCPLQECCAQEHSVATEDNVSMRRIGDTELAPARDEAAMGHSGDTQNMLMQTARTRATSATVETMTEVCEEEKRSASTALSDAAVSIAQDPPDERRPRHRTRFQRSSSRQR